MEIAHVEASNVVPSLIVSQLSKNVPKKVVGRLLKSNLLENLPQGDESRVKNFLRV